MDTVLDFEKPILELEYRIQDLRGIDSQDVDIMTDIKRLERKVEKLLKETYAKLTPWETVQVARHSKRPHTRDYIEKCIDNFTPLAGDRTFAEDAAIMGGIGYFRGIPVMVIGHEKGRDTACRVKHNFGMPRPDGYRKVRRLLDMAHRLSLPVITFVDTAGAHPGADAEERGQSEAIASCIEQCLKIEVPLISVIIGEGGSGGAVALASSNVVLMLEYSVYSVISPEGCASILWRTRDKSADAAKALKLTSKELLKHSVIEGVIPEPIGGAHRDPDATIQRTADELERTLRPLLKLSGKVLRNKRRERFLSIGREKTPQRKAVGFMAKA